VDEDTPAGRAQADFDEGMREIVESNTQNAIAGGYDAIANAMGAIGAEDAAFDAIDAAADARQAAAVDAQQASHWMNAAVDWQTVADDLGRQAEAQGGSFAAGARAAEAEGRLRGQDLEEHERTAAEVEAARSRAEERVLDGRADELGDAAREAAGHAEWVEQQARGLE
jgi:hypothetical protein